MISRKCTCPNELKCWNIWDAVNIAALTQPADIRQPQTCRFLFFPGIVEPAGMTPIAWEFWQDFPGMSIFYKKHLSDLITGGWSPLSHEKKTSTSWNFLDLLHNFCVNRTIRHRKKKIRVLCANRTSRYCNFLDLFLEFSCLSKNDFKQRKRHFKQCCSR